MRLLEGEGVRCPLAHIDGPGLGVIPNDTAAALCAGTLLLLVFTPAWAARDEPAHSWGSGGP
jgi:hypothetical protein